MKSFSFRDTSSALTLFHVGVGKFCSTLNSVFFSIISILLPSSFAHISFSLPSLCIFTFVAGISRRLTQGLCVGVNSAVRTGARGSPSEDRPHSAGAELRSPTPSPRTRLCPSAGAADPRKVSFGFGAHRLGGFSGTSTKIQLLHSPRKGFREASVGAVITVSLCCLTCSNNPAYRFSS